MRARLLRLFLSALLAAPLAIFATILAAPLWRRFEESTGIEAYGHSGPSGWCHLAAYAVVLGVLIFAWVLRRPSPDAG